VDDASPDGTQEVARQLANVYGEDKIVSCIGISVFARWHAKTLSQVLKPRAGKLGLG
jgi:dolichol-phosphate mannosyltransferase